MRRPGTPPIPFTHQSHEATRVNLPTSLSKSKGVVGLDIEASSIAATELQVNGSVRVGGFGIAPLDAGRLPRGRGPRARGARRGAEAALQRQQASQGRPPRHRQPAGRRAHALLAGDRDQAELEAAIRFQAQDQIPMPLDQAVLDWQVIPPAPGVEAQALEVVVVAARRDMLQKAIERGARRRPAPRRYRPLRLRPDPGALRERPSPQPPSAIRPQFDPMAAPAEVGRTACSRRARLAAAGPAWRRPRWRPMMPMAPPGDRDGHRRPAACTATSATSPTSRSPAAPYCLFTRVLNFGIEGIAQTLAERGGLTLEHARQWLIHVGLETPVEAIEGDPEIVRTTREALTSGAAKLGDELRRSLEYYAALEDAVRVESIVVAGAGTDDPGPRRSPAPRASAARRRRDAGRARGRRRRRGRAADAVLRPRAGGVAMRPVNLIPPEERRGDRAPLRAGALSYAIVGVLGAALIGVVLAGDHRQHDHREGGRAARASRHARPPPSSAPRSSLPTASSRRMSESREARPCPAWPRAASTGSASCDELALVIPDDVWLESLTGTRRAAASPTRRRRRSRRADRPVDHRARRSRSPAAPTARSRSPASSPPCKDIDGVTRVGLQQSVLGDETRGTERRSDRLRRRRRRAATARRATSSRPSRSRSPSTPCRPRRSPDRAPRRRRRRAAGESATRRRPTRPPEAQAARTRPPSRPRRRRTAPRPWELGG